MREAFYARRAKDRAAGAELNRARRTRDFLTRRVTPYPHAQRVGNVSTPLSFSYEKESAVDGRKKEYQRGISISPFGIPLKRPRRGLRSPSWIIPGVWFVQSVFQASKNAITMRSGIDRRGSRNTLHLFRLPYVKYSTGANGEIRKIYRAVRKPNLTVARKGVRTTERETITRTTKRHAFLRVSAISRPQHSFLHHLFSCERKDGAAGGIPRLWRGRAGRVVRPYSRKSPCAFGTDKVSPLRGDKILPPSGAKGEHHVSGTLP